MTFEEVIGRKITFNEARNILAIMFYGTEEGKKINRVLFEVDENPWHTGTPTEEGWYLQRIKSKNKIFYDTDYYENGDWKYSCIFREIVAWQKIEEGEELNG